jgi:hypothetical protein
MSTAVLYPREAICGGCGELMLISWRPRYEPGSERPVYVHPEDGGCEFRGKILRPTGLLAGVAKEDEDDGSSFDSIARRCPNTGRSSTGS